MKPRTDVVCALISTFFPNLSYSMHHVGYEVVADVVDNNPIGDGLLTDVGFTRLLELLKI